MDTKGLHELFYAFWDAGVMLSFGRDCVTNIPKDSDPDDTGWHLMLPNMSIFKGKMGIFDRIVEERGLEVKQETHLQIGRLLQEGMSAEERSEKLFVLADHFNRMTANLSDKDAKLRDKIAQLQILSGGIAHEIRNPLSSIGLYLDLLTRAIENNAPCSEYVDKLKFEARTLNEIVNDFLGYAKSGRLKLQEVNLHEIATDALESLRPMALQKQVEMCHYISKNLRLKCDGPKLRQTFCNILTNALEFVPAAQVLTGSNVPILNGLELRDESYTAGAQATNQ